MDSSNKEIVKFITPFPMTESQKNMVKSKLSESEYRSNDFPEEVDPSLIGESSLFSRNANRLQLADSTRQDEGRHDLMAVLTDTLKKAIQVVREYVPVPEINEIGEVTEVQDGVISIAGLKEAMMGEMLIFPHGLKGQVFNLEKELISCILFGDHSLIHQGDRVFEPIEF